MWKIENWGLGVLVAVIGGATAVGQEWPEVISRERGAQGGVWRVQGAQGAFVFYSQSSQPLMDGELESTVEELEAALEIARADDTAAGLAALESATRSAMKARRLLKNVKPPDAGSDRDAAVDPRDEPAWSPDGKLIFFRRRLLSPDGQWLAVRMPDGVEVRAADATPLQQAQDALTMAVNKLRFSADVEEARAALDELDQGVPALRQQLWKKKASGKD